MRPRPAFALSAAVLASVALTACGTKNDPSAPDGKVTADSGAAQGTAVPGVGTVKEDGKLSAMVPGPAKGGVTFATNAPYAPFIDFASKGTKTKFKGLDNDLVLAASAKLGVKPRLVQQPFDGLVPGLQAAKYDGIVGGITDKKARQQVATFVDYSASGTGFLVKAGNPDGVKTVAELCGKKVGVQKASNQQEHLEDYSKSDCGAKPITVRAYPDNPGAVSALTAGSVDAVAATKVALVDIAAQLNGKVEAIDDPAEPNGWLASPNAFGFLKSDADLAKAYQAALQSLIADGTYTKILARYRQEPIALKAITVDQAID